MSNSIKASSIVQTPRSATVLNRAPPGDTCSVMSSRRESYCTERSQPRSAAQTIRSHWSSIRSDLTSCSRRTPISSGKFRTEFSYRKAEVPVGYPKNDEQRNPRRESVVSEFSRKVFEGYDIWEDEDRPVINWKYPQLPIRSNKTHELRKFANIEKINRMVEREKQMNKRNSRFAAPSEKKDTAWWEKPRNGVKTQQSTPRFGTGGGFNSSYTQPNRNNVAAWNSNVSSRSTSYNNLSSRSPYATSRRK